MSFTRRFHTLIQKPNQNIIINSLDTSIKIQNFSLNSNLISSKKIISGKYSFIDVWFDIDEYGNVYGLINAEKNSLMHLYINDKVIIKNTLFKYDYNTFTIAFPYIKTINSSTHIVYYSMENSNLSKCTLVHYYKCKNSWIENKIDITRFHILTNFVVLFENSTPTIFYLNIINGYEELFYSTFDLNNSTWSKPMQITNSRKLKVYLSVIKYNTGIYHITYSENNSNQYYCNYINASIKDDTFTILKDTIISKSIACTFPNILQYNEILYIQWIENHSLYYSFSYNLGATWSEPTIDKASSDYPFNRYIYKSTNNNINTYSIFSSEKSFNILGILKAQSKKISNHMLI
ncbi:hypothetical protein [Clostridium sp.]|uniref:hypothetical protein n=1 Tax=Clostridium sp. TaxID=1506 RepID=UPI00283AE6D1|nr:hypothetical protein [Clostridium sp.]MDR3596485.1 hypothetical protein [Clostridium sp.]